jgi:hypothetical protein
MVKMNFDTDNPIASSLAFRMRLTQYDYDYYSRATSTTTINLNNSETGSHAFAGGTWGFHLLSKPITRYYNGYELNLKVKLESGMVEQCNVAFEIEFNEWDKENYVLLPSAAYNGNRFESRRIAYSPKLLDPRDIGIDKAPIITDVPRLNIHDGPSCIDDRSGSMSTPSAGVYDSKKKQGLWLLTPQRSHLGDFGYRITENRQRSQAVLSISAPVVRQLYKYRITDNQFPSDDKAPDWKEGDWVEIPLQLYVFECNNIQSLYDYWNEIRYNLIPKPELIYSWPFSSTFTIQEEKFNRQNWVEQHGYYSVGMREMFLQDWQIGWTGGMITTYPLLFNGNEQTRQRVIRNFDFLFPSGISPSGFFYDCGETKEDGFHWYGGDIRKPHTQNWHLIRKSGDGLYYIIKQFRLMEKMGIEIKPAWKQGLKQVADAFVKLWETYGQLGNFVDSITGAIIVGGSTSAGIAPAALCYASDYFGDQRYLKVAQETGEYFYNEYVTRGLTMGGVGDAMQNPDSESAYGVLESFCVMYEQTQDPVWLQRAEEMAGQFFSWVISYDYEFPPETTLGKLHIKTHGAVYANTQNKHGAPGICTFSGVALLRLYRATGKMVYLEVLRDIARFIPQMLSHPNRPIEGMQPGWMTERVSTTDWFEGLGELMYGSTFAETCLMLTTVEIPAIYINPASDTIFTFDSLLTRWTKKTDKDCKLWIKNPSEEIVYARILIETPEQQRLPLGENYLYDIKPIRIKAGEEIILSYEL